MSKIMTNDDILNEEENIEKTDVDTDTAVEPDMTLDENDSDEVISDEISENAFDETNGEEISKNALEDDSKNGGKKQSNIYTILLIVGTVIIVGLIALLVVLSNKDDNNDPPTPPAPVNYSYDPPSIKDSGIFAENGMYEGVNVSELVTLPEITGVEIANGSMVFFDEEQKENLFLGIRDALGYSDTITASGTPCKSGDTVTVDYCGKIDGIPFQGGTATDAKVTLGQYRMLKELEDGIMGMQVGETKDIGVTFPEDYGYEDVNGKASVFTVTLKSFTSPKEPDEEYVQKYFKYVGPDLASYKARLFEVTDLYVKEQTVLNELYSEYYEKTTFGPLPEKLYQFFFDLAWYEYAQEFLQAKEYYAPYGIANFSYPWEYYSVTEEEYRNVLAQEAEMQCKYKLFFMAVFEKYGLTLKADDEIVNDFMLYVLYSDRMVSVDEQREGYIEINGMPYIKSSMMTAYLADYLLELPGFVTYYDKPDPTPTPEPTTVPSV